MINMQNLVGGYTQSPIINGIDLQIKQGEFFALLGQNGSGKTTLFKLITGQLPIKSGKISISGKEIQSLSKIEKAKKMAVLTQEVMVSFDYTVEEIISLGRYPHQRGLFKQISHKDRKVIDGVMEITNISDFRKSQFRKLSGGEKQRVLLAKALAQEPEILLLDEPTNHLDIKHTFHMLDLLKERQQTMGLTIFAILHDLNVASLYADRIALLHNGRFLEVGDVDRLRKVEQLKKVYEVNVNSQAHPIVPKPQLLMTPNYAASKELYRFEDSYHIQQSGDCLHIQFDQPLRTISNGDIGEGIQWLKHFCHFHVEKDDAGFLSGEYIQKWMEKYSIPYKQAAGMITSAKLENAVIVTEKYENIHMMAIVTAWGENTNDITKSSVPKTVQTCGTINTMLFIDAHFTNGALMDGYMAATEAKVKALQDLNMATSLSITDAFSTTTDTLLIGLTQQGRKISSAGSGTDIGKGIGQMAYRAIKDALGKSLQREVFNNEINIHLSK
ncbi:adenosylcobinamide amidohydrolase [Bacillus benzoevorans]|uniref:Iron complex transport system ATP-binding protein n=1 Tax=Bacillus benzoevorans TaxID=1456 RepID=A0A7X0HVY3_9BACI|nr:adenosylcobinamide amidohydrolase [Bacillus benzoevorans]MBB6446927.1 iron complex transport system ATP-binding protein [Bacillus benzoevorans]